MVLMPGFQSTQLATEGALEPFFFLYTDDSIQGNPETCKQSSIMLNYEVKNTMALKNNIRITRKEEYFQERKLDLYGKRDVIVIWDMWKIRNMFLLPLFAEKDRNWRSIIKNM